MARKTKEVRLSAPQIGRAELRGVRRVLKSGKLAQGGEVEAFETEFSNIALQGRQCATANSGTSALHLALLAHGIGHGDEVIVPSFTFGGTANAVVLTGATPLFADIDPNTFTIDPASAAALVSPRTKAILPVHLFGLPADMERLGTIATHHNLVIVEDAAQAHLAEIHGKRVGTFGDSGVFSFYATKNMTTGEGGIVTSSPDVLRQVQLLRNQGMQGRYKYEVVGFNNRMTDLQAAIGRAQLQRVELWTKRRIRNAEFFLENIQGVGIPATPPGFRHVFHQFCIIVPEDRDGFSKALREFGVESAVYYPEPLHDVPSMREYFLNDLPHSTRISQQILAIPVRPELSRSELERIVTSVNSLSRAGA